VTQTLTQTTQKMDGNNGVDPSKEHLLPEQTGPESGGNRRLETVRAPTDQKAGSSNLSGRTKTREKPCVSCGFYFLLFLVFFLKVFLQVSLQQQENL